MKDPFSEIFMILELFGVTEVKVLREVVYDRSPKSFVMVGDELSMMTNREILAVSKILLESRAFMKRNLKAILDKIVE